MKVTLRTIKCTPAHDITAYSFEQMNELFRETDLEEINYSLGQNGKNGCLLQDRKTGEFYKICARSTALAMV
jgi:hypothetical protein